MKRLSVALITGAVLGVFCIIGVATRFGVTGNTLFLIAMWYNRVIMGLVIGLASKTKQPVKRGLVIGLLVSAAFYLSTSFKDLMGFLAGIIYGAIIEYVADKYGD